MLFNSYGTLGNFYHYFIINTAVGTSVGPGATCVALYLIHESENNKVGLSYGLLDLHRSYFCKPRRLTEFLCIVSVTIYMVRHLST